MIKDLPGAMLAYDMGTGKSKTVVDAICNIDDIQVALIVCPKSVMAVWPREFSRHASVPVAIYVLETGQSVDKKVEIAKQGILLSQARKQKVVLVINYDSARIPAFQHFSLNRAWDLVVADESHRAKSHNSKTSRYMGELGLVAKRRVCLTGTPMPHSPLDVFGQYRFLSPDTFGRWWTHFKNRYARMGGFQRDGRPVQIVGINHEDELNEKFYSIAHRVMKRDVIKDLPPVTHETVDIDLSPTARKHYAELETQFVTEVRQQLVTVQHALTKLLRLQQATSGFLVPDEGEDPIEIHSSKKEALKEILEDLTDQPVVVFCRFKYDIRQIKDVCDSCKRPVMELSGSANELADWQQTKKSDGAVIVVQIQAGGVGIDLTHSSYSIYYSLGFSLGDYEQSLARIDRPGQKEPVTYFHLIAKKTVDERVYGALRKRKRVVESILDEMRLRNG